MHGTHTRIENSSERRAVHGTHTDIESSSGYNGGRKGPRDETQQHRGISSMMTDVDGASSGDLLIHA